MSVINYSASGAASAAASGVSTSMGEVGNSICCSVSVCSIWSVTSIAEPLLLVENEAITETTRMNATRPRDLLKDVGGLAYAKGLVACGEVAGKAFSLTVLEQYHENEEDCSDNDEDDQYCKKCVHISCFYLFRQ